MTQLRIGMPAGSLADPQRGGNLVNLLGRAGFPVSGYEKGGPSHFTGNTMLFGWDGRPQEFGAQLALDELDVAIGGDDWITERLLELELEYGRKVALERVLELRRGNVRIVGIAPGDCPHDTIDALLRDLCAHRPRLTVVAEMPYLTLRWLHEALRRQELYDRFRAFSVQKYGTPPRIEAGLVIYETWGKTEAKVRNGGADLGVEITQTGSAIANYGLKIIDTILTSQTAIWIRPSLRQDAERMRLLKMLLLNLHGCLAAEDKVLVVFNVPNAATTAIEAYLAAERLFGDEPTVNRGRTHTEYSIQVDVANPRTPIAQVRFRLAELGARSIDTLPIQSSIPGLEVLGL
jgi:ATP phosphoribosyltransferase